MSQILTATVEGGILKPDAPLAFPDQTRVRVILDPISEGDADSRAAMHELEKLWDGASVDSEGVRLTRDQMHERH